MTIHLSTEQYAILRSTLREKGSLPMAAHLMGLSLTRLRAMAAKDEDLKIEIEDALEFHGALIYDCALERATNGKSDAMLGKILEAKVTGFSKESREPLSQRNKPTGLRLRTFDADGEESGVQDVAPKPLQLELRPGL
jgi:hypothetical protein